MRNRFKWLGILCCTLLLFGGCGSSSSDDDNKDSVTENDTNVADTNVVDTNVADTNVADTNVGTDSNVMTDTTGEDTSPVPDTNGADASVSCKNPISPAADGGLVGKLIISEIKPGDYIELLNVSGSDFKVADHTYELCSPFAYKTLEELTSAAFVIPAGKYAKIPWPSAFSNSTAAGGELVLYQDPSGHKPENMVDYICWGNVTPGRKTEAEGNGVNKWSGDCAAAPQNGVLTRKDGTPGNALASYELGGNSTVDTCAVTP